MPRSLHEASAVVISNAVIVTQHDKIWLPADLGFKLQGSQEPQHKNNLCRDIGKMACVRPELDAVAMSRSGTERPYASTRSQTATPDVFGLLKRLAPCQPSIAER